MKLIRYFLAAYPARSIATLVFLLAAGAAEALGLATLLPLVGSAFGSDAPAAGQASWLGEQVDLAFDRMGVEPNAQNVGVIFLTLLVAKAAVLLISKRQVGYAAARIVTDMRMDLLRALLSARWSYYTDQPIGALANSFGTEATRVASAFRNLAISAQFSILTVAYLCVAVALSWQLMLGAIAGGVVMWMVLHTWVRVAGRAGQQQTVVLKSMLTRLTDGLQSMRLLKATGREDAIGPLLAQDTKQLKRALKNQVVATESLAALQEPLVGICVLGLIYFAIEKLGMGGSSVFVMVYAVARGLFALNKVQRRFQVASVDSSAVFSLLEMIKGAEKNVEAHPGRKPPRLEEGLELRDVSVSYSGKGVLDGVSLRIPAGKITSIAGESGAGKTTLIDTITGLVTADSGDVWIDGVSLSEIDLMQWRHMIGFVPQEALMLHESIRANVTLGDESLSTEQVEQALRAAGAWDFVEVLPAGIDEPVGEKGARFSGGQRARIALARALIRKPRLLILDEATSSLDAAAERAIWDALERQRGDITIVAVSHQPHLETIADCRYQLRDGRVAAAEEKSSPAAAAASAGR